MMTVQKTAPSKAAFTIITLVTCAYFIHLGLWQLERRVWKEDLLQKITSITTQDPQDITTLLPPNHTDQEEREDGLLQTLAFTPVTLNGVFENTPPIRLFTTSGVMGKDVTQDQRPTPGVSYLAPFRIAQMDKTVLINVGFESYDRAKTRTEAPALPQTPVTLSGVMLPPEKQHPLAGQLKDDSGLYYLRIPERMLPEKPNIAPFSIHLLPQTPLTPELSIQVLKPNLPNNHLNYALTWFSLATVLALTLGFWLWPRRTQSQDRKHEM